VTALARTSRQRVENELSQIRAYLRQPEPLDTAIDYRVRADNRRKWEKRREQLEERATFLESFLRATPATPRTTGGERVAPGRLVGLTFDGSAAVEEYEITSQSPVGEDGQALSPFTPLAAALLWREAGLPVEYEDGSGKRRTAHIRHVRD
jgi:transcription elongation GreA/GreB family factor